MNPMQGDNDLKKNFSDLEHDLEYNDLDNYPDKDDQENLQLAYKAIETKKYELPEKFEPYEMYTPDSLDSWDRWETDQFIWKIQLAYDYWNKLLYYVCSKLRIAIVQVECPFKDED